MSASRSRCLYVATTDDLEGAQRTMRRVRYSDSDLPGWDKDEEPTAQTLTDLHISVPGSDWMERSDFGNNLSKVIPSDLAAVVIDDVPKTAKNANVSTLFRYLSNNNILGVLVADVTAEEHHFIEFLADVVICLRVVPEFGHMVRTLEIAKSRAMPSERGQH